MKSNTFNYSLLAVGVAAVLGISTTANAVDSGTTTTDVSITNQASASYNVGTVKQPDVVSNEVKITVSEKVSFSLVADNDDSAAGGQQGDDTNIKEKVAPNGFAVFRHTLTNTGNRDDIYTVNLTGADTKYNPSSSTVSFEIYNKDQVPGTDDPVFTGENISYADTNGQEFPLEMGQFIKFTLNAKTIGNKGEEVQQLTISAKSKALTDNGAGVNTLTNTDGSFTRLPTFGIVKTITNGLDLNDMGDTATYKVVVTNQSTDFSTDATDIDIADFLPAGLVLAVPLTSTNISPSSTATVGDIDASAAGDSGFNVTGNTIPVGQNITFLFTVKQGGSGTLDPATAINHVTVTDDLDNGATDGNTLVDSTDTGKELLVDVFYPTTETNYTDGGQRTLETGDDSTGPLSIGGTIQRALTLSGVTVREIAPTSGTLGQVTHTTVITNTGKDVEGSNAGELTFTIDDNDADAPDAINIVPGSVTVTYYPDGDDTTTPTVVDKEIKAVDGVYDIKSALPGGIATDGTVTINYKVSSVDAPLYSPSNTTTPTFEDTIVTLIPKLEGAPTIPPVTDVTTVRGLVLLKTQAIDKTCSGSATTFVSTPLTDDDGAKPGECIIYKVQAQNTSSADASSSTGVGFDITNIVILDAFSNFENEADYEVDSVTTTKGTAAQNSDNVTTTIDTLAPQETATMQFSVKIKTARVITTP
ncbi:hypothetical protein [Psychrobacter sp. 72-O-c]|uniref:hypothetical protein n=1 Tax=Psychrobacter sp. 72-O-c TaxID=2774125 RepID=UPI00191B38F9|nr:hypothetical protein [Psychrobacter sp. 72-O-c]